MLDPDEREDDRDRGTGRALAVQPALRERRSRDDAVEWVDGATATNAG